MGRIRSIRPLIQHYFLMGSCKCTKILGALVKLKYPNYLNVYCLFSIEYSQIEGIMPTCNKPSIWVVFFFFLSCDGLKLMFPHMIRISHWISKNIYKASRQILRLFFIAFMTLWRDFVGGPVSALQSLVWELRSHMPHSMTKKELKIM